MRFVVVDTTGTKSAGEIVRFAAALQRQLREHYAPCFDGDSEHDAVRPAAGAGDVQAGEFPLKLIATAPNREALGVHDLDGGYCYLDLAAESGASWTAIMSHEALEARADRRLHACVELDDGSIWDREICDRVESLTYSIDGVEVSNFNTPECFEPPPGWRNEAPRREPGMFDWLGASSEPNQVIAGGYAQQYTPGHGWQVRGEMSAYRSAVAARGLSRGSARKARPLHRAR